MNPHPADMPANDITTDSPLTFGDLLAALRLISKKAPPRSLVSRLQNVSCSIGNSNHCSTLISNSFHIKDHLESIELTYAVSPPGARDTKMSKMKLQFSFSGEVGGKLDIWLKHPQELRPEGSYKFGLGISAMRQSPASESKSSLIFEKKKEALVCDSDLTELELDGKDLMGGELQVFLFAAYPCRGVLSVHLLASTCDDDPKTESTVELADEETEEFIECAMCRWNSRAYQREVLGGETMETYLEH